MKQWRVAISSNVRDCWRCSDGLQEGADFCPSCQRTYIGRVDFRLDYADETVGWFETEEEALAALERLVPMD